MGNLRMIDPVDGMTITEALDQCAPDRRSGMTDTERLDFVIERQITVHHYPIGGGPHKYYTLQWRTFGGKPGPYANTPRAAIDAAIHQQHCERLPS